MKDYIYIKGAKVNNLKNIDVKIPRDKLVVFTGLSGSGKSSLAFDTLFAEGQRRYIESLSSYARQFLGQMDKPDVEYIEGLSPAISIDQKTTSNNPRSTVGTVTEIYDYLRLLYARIGVPHCPNCGKEIRRQTVDEITDKVMKSAEGAQIRVLAPVVRGRKGEFGKQLDGYLKSGYTRVEIDGKEYSLDAGKVSLDKNLKHVVSVVVSRLKMKPDILSRLSAAVESALKLAGGLVDIAVDDVKYSFSTEYACPDCDINMEELTPRLFSFNSPFGACAECSGLGFKSEIDVNKVIKNKNLSISDGAVSVSGWNIDSSRWSLSMMRALSERYGFSLDVPVKDLPQSVINVIMYGDNESYEMNYESSTFNGTFSRTYEGVATNLMRRYRDTTSDSVKRDIERYMSTNPCSCCGGKRLRAEALGVTVGGKDIYSVTQMSISECKEFFEQTELKTRDTLIAAQILKEIGVRLNFLINVGLDYLSLCRASSSLSGGEAQRIRLATQIGSGLMGVLYILDEPSIGLHQRDNDKLITALENLRDLGNTLIVVEHDEDTMRRADYIIDVGRGAGVHGGRIIAEGTPAEVMANAESVTGKYMSGEMFIPVPKQRRTGTAGYLKVRGARQNNLKNIDVAFPLGKITAVTGVSGSGKSSLVNEVLYPVLQSRLNKAQLTVTSNCDGIEGVELLDKVICIDQSPIGRTPRSNPATYTGVFSDIRELFAGTTEAKARGYKAGRFSFNVSGGRCENCSGDGTIKIEMHFLPDVYVPCEVCGGKRYNRETLQVTYKGKNIYDVLDMTVEEALIYFENIPKIYNSVKTLFDVGLSYIKLGQPATTLSGGEAQRVKLATELAKRSTGKTVYILDEPTTGLHTDDVYKLIKIMDKLADKGNTVIVIEHNLDVIKIADYIVDLGKEGGDKGGSVIATGTPEEVAKSGTYTGEFLKSRLIKEHYR